jgi:phosphatidate phosphatase APP1
VHLLSSLAGGAGAMGRSEVLVPPPDATFGIISDVDDTVVATRAAHRLERTRIILLNDAHQRRPFPGVAALYRALARGPDGQGANPLFFLSRSPWNLYDLFHRFFALHHLPPAPLFLEDTAQLEPPSQALGGRVPKAERIRRLLELYPRLPFVLVGDSGQEDPEVYREVVRRFPGRIRAVFIRDVSSKAKRDREVERIVQEVCALGVPMRRSRDSVEIATHAAGTGLIAPDAVQAVREDCARKG